MTPAPRYPQGVVAAEQQRATGTAEQLQMPTLRDVWRAGLDRWSVSMLRRCRDSRRLLFERAPHGSALRQRYYQWWQMARIALVFHDERETD